MSLARHLSDPAVCLIYGTSGFDITVARPGGTRRQANRRIAMCMRGKPMGQAGAPWGVEKPCC